jgi:hypothetical protein
MIGNDIRDGHTGIFEQRDFEYIDSGKIALVGEVGEEEGTGSWAFKKIVIRRGSSFIHNDFSETIDWDEPLIELHSSNPIVEPWKLDPSGQYRVRGVLLRVLRPEQVVLVG